MPDPLLDLNGARKLFPVHGKPFRRSRGVVRAVDGVDLSIGRGETVALVGESGCGKSTLARLILGLERPDGGTASFDGKDIFAATGDETRTYRRRVQIIFQDPYSSLNPRVTVAGAIIRSWKINPGVVPKAQWRARALALLEDVGLSAAQADRYPHQLSGGQRQRVAIARALALEPQLVVCDEPVSALDVSVQAQVLLLLRSLQQRLNLSYLFISHDLGVVRRVAHRVAVMYLGRIVETGPAAAIFESPAHPYTQALLSAVPVVDPGRRSLETRQLLQGDPPSPIDPPSGCRFRTRCPRAQKLCAEKDPQLEVYETSARRVACHFPGPAAAFETRTPAHAP